jgi:hypothetical protein
MSNKTISNKVFIGCNYNDRKIKSQFDSLKKKLERKYPISIVLIDMKVGKHAKDIWQDIQKEIQEASALFFDVSGFRPNVVLELGFALAIKYVEQIYITYRSRNVKGVKPKWMLSDIGHLNRQEYKNVGQLEEYVESQVKKMEYIDRLKEFERGCGKTSSPDRYIECGKEILTGIRDDGPKSKQQIMHYTKGTSCRTPKLITLLKKHDLIKGTKGKYQKFDIASEILD